MDYVSCRFVPGAPLVKPPQPQAKKNPQRNNIAAIKVCLLQSKLQKSVITK